MIPRAFMTAVVFLISPLPALAEVFRCTQDNRTIFTDKPCTGGKTVDVKAVNTVGSLDATATSGTVNLYSSSQWLEGMPGYDRALRLAQRHEAPLLIFFRVDWCPYSKAVESGLLPDPVAIKAMTSFVKVRIDPEKGDAENRLFKSLGGKGFPRMVVVPYQQQWELISVTHSANEKHTEKHISAQEFSENLAPFQPPRPLPTAQDHHRRAREMLGKGNLRQALSDAKTAISREPTGFDHYKLLDDILSQQRDFKQIIAYWNSFIRLSPNNDKAYLERAGSHRQNGDMNAAIADLKISAELGNPEAARLYQYVQNGMR